MLSFAHFTTFFLSLLVCVCHVSAAPIGRPSQSLAARCNVAARDNSTTTVDITASNGTSTSGNGTDITSTGNSTTSTEPRWVVYGDQWVSGITGPPPAADLAGYNVYIMSFLQTTGAVDKAQEWASLSADQIKSLKASYASAGISLLVSAFGYGDNPVTNNKDPVQTANTMAAWVKQWSVDGIDLDWEDFDAWGKNDGKAEDWIIAFIKQLRAQLPQGEYIITSAPIAPWFIPTKPGGGFLRINKEVGDLVDWYNMQFYNQQTMYTDCDGLLNASNGFAPQTSLFELAGLGVPLNKMVIGKPATEKDAAAGGYMDPNMLSTCLAQAKAKGWNAGAMVWAHPNANSEWIKTVRGSSWPV